MSLVFYWVVAALTPALLIGALCLPGQRREEAPRSLEQASRLASSYGRRRRYLPSWQKRG